MQPAHLSETDDKENIRATFPTLTKSSITLTKKSFGKSFGRDASIEEILDTEEYSIEYSPYDELQKDGHAQSTARAIIDYYNPVLEEAKELVHKKTPDLVEGYSHMSVPTRKKYLEFLQHIVDDTTRFVMAKKATRKTSKPRTKSAYAQVSKLQYLKESKEFLSEANYEMENDNFFLAEAAYREAIATNPEEDTGKYNLGIAYYDKEMNDVAMSRFKQAAAVADTKSDKHKVFHNLGNTFMNEKLYKEAVESYKNALRNNPKDEETRYNYALAKELLEEQEKNGGGDDNKENQENQEDKQEEEKKEKLQSTKKMKIVYKLHITHM